MKTDRAIRTCNASGREYKDIILGYGTYESHVKAE